jgi:hypothetical protein
MIKAIGSYIFTVAAILTLAVPAHAQQSAAFGVGGDAPPQTINFTLGIFSPVGAEDRVDGDVLVEDCRRIGDDCTFLDFDIDDLKSVTFGAEYLLPIGNYLEFGAGLSYTQKTLASSYAEFVADDPLTPEVEEDEIEQDLKLRQLPLAFTIRVLPLGAANPVQPYFGGGIGVISWKYSEVGEFVDADLDVFRDEFEDSGVEVAPLIVGGVRFALDSFSIGGEVRWQKAEADLDVDQFIAPKLDLGGWTYQLTLGLRFD